MKVTTEETPKRAPGPNCSPAMLPDNMKMPVTPGFFFHILYTLKNGIIFLVITLYNVTCLYTYMLVKKFQVKQLYSNIFSVYKSTLI